MNGRAADESSPADRLSLIRQGREADGVTVSTSSDDRTEAIMPVLAAPRRKREDLYQAETSQRYVAPMTTTAQNIAGAFRDHLPGLSDRKLHTLLYLAQGVCLAANNQPLFVEPITSTTTSVLVDLDNPEPVKPLDDAQAAVVRVVVARYGALTGTDLEAMVRGQDPWQNARRWETDEISEDWISRYFHAADEDPDGTVSGIPRSVRAQLYPPAALGRGAPDSPEEIEAFIAEVRKG